MKHSCRGLTNQLFSCQGNYKGSTCELDGEVLGVAVGASVAAIIIIILTLVMLCMWSRRWRQNQDKVVNAGPYVDQLKTMPFAAFMQDRLRWAQYAEAMASAHNLYAVSTGEMCFFFSKRTHDLLDTRTTTHEQFFTRFRLSTR